MSNLTLKEMAVRIAKRKKSELRDPNIAQITTVLAGLFEELTEYPDSELKESRSRTGRMLCEYSVDGEGVAFVKRMKQYYRARKQPKRKGR